MDLKEARSIVHELTNSLTTVIGAAELLVAELPESGQPAEDARDVLNAAYRGRDALARLGDLLRAADHA